MASQIGILKTLIGSATATAADGTSRNLQLGDIVYADERVSTGSAGTLEIELWDGRTLDLGQNSQIVLDNNVYGPVTPEAEQAAEAQVEAVQEAILAGADPTELAEATAAGAGAVAGNEGADFVQVDYLAPEVTPTSGFDTTGISVAFPELEAEELPVPELEPEPIPLLPTLSVDDVTVTEPDSGYGEDYDGPPSVIATFTVTLSEVSDQDVTVTFTTADGTAIGGTGIGEYDYGSESVTVLIPAGSTTQTVDVEVFGDRVTEITERYFVNLSNPVNALIADGQGIGTILDNDQDLIITIADTQETISEEGGGTNNFTISLSEAINSGNIVTVDVDFASGTTTQAADFITAAEASLQAIADATDGVSFDGTTLTYNDAFVGTDLSFSVTAFDDDLLDSPETLNVTLSNATAVNGSAVAADSEDVTITDLDQAITISIADTQETISEEGGGSNNFTISLSEAINSGNIVTVDVDFVTGTTTQAVDFITTAQASLQAIADATDGVSFDGTTLTYNDAFVGTDLSFSVTAFDDDLLDSPETLNVTLSNATALNGTAVAADAEDVTITDVDNAISFAINVISENVEDDAATQQATITEENDADDVATFTIVTSGFPLTGVNEATVDINFTGSADSADFVTAALASLTAALPGGVSILGNTLTFTSAYDGSPISFSIEAVDDGFDEGPEDRIATLSNETVDSGTVAIVTDQDVATVDIIDADTDFPAGLAYSVAGGGGSGSVLYGLDLATGATFEIGAVVVGTNDKVQFSSLTLNPTDGFLYGLGDQGNLNGFVRVNAATGEAELLFSDSLLNASTSGVAFATNGDLYIGINDDFYRVASANVSTMSSVTDMGSPVVSFDNSGVKIDSMAYDSGSDTFFFVSQSQLYSIAADGSETTATEIGTGIGDTIDGLSFDESGTLWGADNLGTIYRIDTTSGAGTLVATISNSDVQNSGIHSLAISQLAPGTYITITEEGNSHTEYYAFDGGVQQDSFDSAALSGLLATSVDSEVDISITGRTVSVTQSDTSDPVDAIAIRVDAAAAITVDGFDQTDVFTRDGDPSAVTVTGAEGGTIQTGQADDIISITSNASDGGIPNADETYTVNTDGGDDVINLTDLEDSSYTIQAGEGLDFTGFLSQSPTDVDTVVIDGSIDLGNGPISLNNVEVLDISGTGDNTLTLSATNVLDASDDTNTLIVKGNSGDIISSDDDWTAGPTGVEGVDGNFYDVFIFDTGLDIVTLLVDGSVDVTGL